MKDLNEVLEICRIAWQELSGEYGRAEHPGVMNLLDQAILKLATGEKGVEK